MYNKEIEFKNLLTFEEYNKIFDYYNFYNVEEFINENYYYDTLNKKLKNNNSALRIRINKFLKEITLKIKEEKGNIEINEHLDKLKVEKVLQLKELPVEISKYMLKNNIVENFYLIQKIITYRRELKIGEGLLVLDKTMFLNNIVDYEVEFEVSDYAKGKKYFESILKNLKIEKKEAQPKIARACEYTNK